ncbi:hypothetical protein B0H63DRAFT_88100 [Podospora didyma]|uniref:Uncharacterized protein n=1 Tax=Podospora didyma TaxID=330526 RepID=A0AAE0K1M3_9PEZI|nr:hypothetical protein B0H63DRAFT_88100 [Podospora didyma]
MSLLVFHIFIAIVINQGNIVVMIVGQPGFNRNFSLRHPARHITPELVKSRHYDASFLSPRGRLHGGQDSRGRSPPVAEMPLPPKHPALPIPFQLGMKSVLAPPCPSGDKKEETNPGRHNSEYTGAQFSHSCGVVSACVEPRVQAPAGRDPRSPGSASRCHID